MKKTALLLAAACTAAAAVPFSASADDAKVYGTMNIPYSDFYAAEIDSAYEVDAVSSATENKWKMNQTGSVGEDGAWKNGGLVAGTYNDDNGTILGVNFPVEVNAADAEKLEKYGFTALDFKPAAYKEVTLSGDSVSVSKVIDTNGEQNVSGSAEVSTSSRYGDYQLNVKGYPENCDLYGVIVNTRSGEKYAMRHLENIWRSGQLAWSAGIVTKEGHGNELKFDDYASSMGKTVTSVTFITLDGYTTVDIGENYLPVKFAGEVKAEDSAAGTGKTSLSLTGFPDDYKKKIEAGDGFTATETEISYTNAKPGSYTVNVTDESGKYAPMSGSFMLTTADIPVKFDGEKLVKADGFSDDDAANFIKNIASVKVGETSYNAAGKRSVKIFDADGKLDLAAKSGENNVFDGSGNYTVTVTATGYTSPYTFEIKSAPVVTSTAATTTSRSSTTTTAKANSKGNPQTGVAGAAIPAAALALACMTAFAARRKND